MYWLPPGDCTASTYLIIHRKVYAYMDKTGNICFNFYFKTIYKKMQNKESQQTDAISRICFNFTVADAHHAVCLLCLARTGFFKNIFRKF